MASCTGSGWRVRTQQDIDRRRMRLNSQGVPFFQPKRDKQYSWLHVHRAFKADTKKFLQSKETKALRESSTQSSTHHLRDASRQTLHEGFISASTNAEDDHLNRQANVAKHRTSPGQKKWAQENMGILGSSTRAFADSGAGDMSSSSASFAANGVSSSHWMSADETLSRLAWADTEDDNNEGDEDLERLLPTDHFQDNGALASEDLEHVMPTDIHSDSTSLTKGALPELAAHLNRRRAALDAASASFPAPVSVDCFGHLQTFYISRSEAAAKEENCKLHSANCELCQRIAHLEDENRMLSIQLQNCLAFSLNNSSSVGSNFSSDGNGFSIGGLFDGNFSGFFSGGFAPFVPMEIVKQNMCGPLPQPASATCGEQTAAARDLLLSDSGSDLLLRIAQLETICRQQHQLQCSSDSPELTHRIERLEKAATDIPPLANSPPFEELCAEIHKSFQTLRTELFDEAKDLGAFDQQKEFQELQALKEEVRVEWKSRLEGIQVAFQCKLDAIDRRFEADETFEEQFETCIKAHLLDDRLLELSRKLQECRCRLHSLEEDRFPTLETGLNSAVCRQLQCNSDSDELKLRLKRLEDLVPPAASGQLQCGADSELLLRIVRLEERIAGLEVPCRAGFQEVCADHGHSSTEMPSLAGVARTDSGGEAGSAGADEKSQPCTSDLFAKFAALQNKRKKESEEANLDHPCVGAGVVELVPRVDMGNYVSNSVLQDVDRPAGSDNEDCLFTTTVKHSQHNEASAFRQRRIIADGGSSEDGEDGRSETPSQRFAQRIIDEGYDPYDIGFDSPLHTDEERGNDSDPDGEPWT